MCLAHAQNVCVAAKTTRTDGVGTVSRADPFFGGGRSVVGHADVILKFELGRAPCCQLVFLWVDDSVVERLDRKVVRPVLQLPLVLCCLEFP